MIDPDDPEAGIHPDPAPAPEPGSVLDRIHKDLARKAETKVLRVGRSTTLAARYRSLTDAEIKQINKRVETISKLQRRNDNEADEQAERLAAFTLASACEEILWIGDGGKQPLVQVLKSAGVDTRGDGPMRYDRRLAQVLQLELGEKAGGSDVVIDLHTLRDEDGQRVNLLPLDAAFDRYNDFVNEVRGDELDEVLEGS